VLVHTGAAPLSHYEPCEIEGAHRLGGGVADTEHCVLGPLGVHFDLTKKSGNKMHYYCIFELV